MVSLLSSMAEDPPAIPMPTMSCQTMGSSSTMGCPMQRCPLVNNRIPVSDDDESESESSDCDSDEDDDNSEYSATSSENENEPIDLSGSDFDNILTLDLDEHCDPCETNCDPCETNCETKSIHLHEPTDFSIFKSINISDDVSLLTQMDASLVDASLVDASIDYKKMPITKLREIAQQNGHSDVSKLKKPEILKLLEVE
jgi:hypothetical protein